MKAFMMVVVLTTMIPATVFADGPPPAKPAATDIDWSDPNVVGQSMTGMFQAMTRLMERIDANTAAIQELKKTGAGDNGDGAYIHRAFGNDAIALARSRACSNDADPMSCIAFEESYKTPKMRRAIAAQYVREMREGNNTAAEIDELRNEIADLGNDLRSRIRDVAHITAVASDHKVSKAARRRAIDWLANN